VLFRSAYALGAPVLLVEPGSIPAEVSAEITRLGATKAVVLGGTGAVSSKVAADLATAGLSVERIGGGDRYGTSALIALRLRDASGETTLPTVFVATGAGYADALAAAPVAARLRAPILLTRQEKLPEPTAGALESLGTTRAVVLGGVGAVGPNVVARLSSEGIACERLAGADRFATGASVASWGLAHGMDLHEAVLATGRDFPDALAAGAYAARQDVNLLLVDNAGYAVPTGVAALLRARKSEVATITVVGGEGTVWLPIQQSAAQAIFTPR
jgi:putative cell wall-binding protein